MTNRMRADVLLVKRGFFNTRARAQDAIAAGLVVADGQVVRKASESVPETAQLAAQAPHPYVSRGGLKLAAALEHYGMTPAGQLCLDVGASTGGFTDVLLRRGARQVVAVDTGTAQMHASLRGDPRILLMESTDIRKLTLTDMPSPADMAVIDVSFIPLALVLPAVSGLLAPSATIIALVKPQFEVGRAHIGKGGIVRDEAVRLEAVQRASDALAALGFRPHPAIPSPISGGDGNTEYLVAAQRSGA